METDAVSFGTDPLGLSRIAAAVFLAPGVVWDGAAEADTYSGTANDDTLDGKGGDDHLSGGEGNDVLRGGSERDTLDGGLGADLLEGGTGFDFTSYASAASGLTVNLARSAANTGEAAGDTYSSIQGLIGSAFNDRLAGDIDTNHLIGGEGDDTLEGGSGSDTLEGGAGNDLYIDPLGDTIIDISGIDTIWTSTSYILGAAAIQNLAALDVNGTAALMLGGNDLNNALTGNQGDNKLDGKGGADTLIGGLGNDTYIVDQAGDQVRESAGGGYDAVVASTSYALALDAEIEVLRAESSTDSTPLNFSGSNFDNMISGNAGTNTLKGYGGKDVVSAGAGTDQVYGGAGDDTLYGGAGSDRLYGEGGRDVFVFDSKPARSNLDKIYGYKASEDAISLDNAVFTKLGKGTFAKPAKFKADMFVEGKKAQDREDRIVYDKKTGALYFDKDGTGGSAQVKIATLTNKTKLYYHDFFVV